MESTQPFVRPRLPRAAKTASTQCSPLATNTEKDAKLKENRYAGFAGGTAANWEYIPPELSVDEPPRFTIDLSLPPERRYVEVCTAFAPQLRSLPPLFDDVVHQLSRLIPLTWIHYMCALLLRCVYDKEETAELKGISLAIGIDMYLLVCFNVLLDLFMGCSSGGAAVSDGNGGSKMLHFRTLDWGMDPLRKIVVQLDFVTKSGGPVVASSITYAGYVGILTGVRQGLSVSLNFRPTRNNKYHVWSDILYYWHLFLVLLGWRRSISSHLREILLHPSPVDPASSCYKDALSRIRGRPDSKTLRSTACYLCLSDGHQTTVFEKDRVTSVERMDDVFIAITNNDVSDDKDLHVNRAVDGTSFIGALADIVAEAKDRRQCTYDNYQHRRLNNDMTADDIIWLVQRYPTTNEATHYACVMDPSEGVVVWCRRWNRPVTAKWIREHE